MKLLSIRQAAKLGFERLRKPEWVDPCAHLRVSAVDGVLGLWHELHDPFNLECNGRDPVRVLGVLEIDIDAEEYLPHDGPTHDSEEYRAAQKRYEGCLGSR